MTGRMPSLHGVRSNGIPLHFDNVVFTDLLRAGGYRTALVGKCHLQNMTDRAPEIAPEPRAGLHAQVRYPEARRPSVGAPEYEQELRSRWRSATHQAWRTRVPEELYSTH